MKNAVIISEEVVPGDAWERFCERFGAKAVTRFRFDADTKSFTAYDDGSIRHFTLHLDFEGGQSAFEMDADTFLEYMEQTFHESVRSACAEMREEIIRLRSAGQKKVLL